MIFSITYSLVTEVFGRILGKLNVILPSVSSELPTNRIKCLLHCTPLAPSTSFYHVTIQIPFLSPTWPSSSKMKSFVCFFWIPTLSTCSQILVLSPNSTVGFRQELFSLHSLWVRLVWFYDVQLQPETPLVTCLTPIWLPPLRFDLYPTIYLTSLLKYFFLLSFTEFSVALASFMYSTLCLIPTSVLMHNAVLSENVNLNSWA